MCRGLYHFGVATYSLEPTPKQTKDAIAPTNILKGLKSLSIREDALCRTSYVHWVQAAAPTLKRLRCRMYSSCQATPNLRSLLILPSHQWLMRYLSVT